MSEDGLPKDLGVDTGLKILGALMPDHTWKLRDVRCDFRAYGVEDTLSCMWRYGLLPSTISRLLCREREAVT